MFVDDRNSEPCGDSNDVAAPLGDANSGAKHHFRFDDSGIGHWNDLKRPFYALNGRAFLRNAGSISPKNNRAGSDLSGFGDGSGLASNPDSLTAELGVSSKQSLIVNSQH